jgi:uncharacterized protein (UPF0332 family)
MSLHSDLLSQALHLVNRERRRPRQASLRRAVSTAYYALFHLLIHEASTMLVPNAALRLIVSRAFAHTEMNKAPKSFAGGTLPNKFGPVTGGAPIPNALIDVARAFVDLQQARHEADYNLAKSFAKNEAKALIDQVAQAFHDWQAVRGSDHAQLYLACLLLWERLDKVR